MIADAGPDVAGLGFCARPAMAASVLRCLRRFAAVRGIPADTEFLLDYDVIEAFCVAGLAGRADSTRGTYRSALYGLAWRVHGGPGMRATPFAGAKAPPPYSVAERAELAAVAAAQRGPAKRASALAIVVSHRSRARIQSVNSGRCEGLCPATADPLGEPRPLRQRSRFARSARRQSAQVWLQSRAQRAYAQR